MGSRCSSRTASGAIRTCGGWSPGGSPSDYRVILFDHIGAGGSDLTAYDDRHARSPATRRTWSRSAGGSSCTDVIFVGHSVSAMIGVLAAEQAPELFAHLVLVGPSPRYINDGDYVGGFDAQDIAELLDSLDSNYLGWSQRDRPRHHGQPRPARAGRGAGGQLLPHRPRDRQAVRSRHLHVRQPRRSVEGAARPSLVLQCTNDAIAPVAVGAYVADQLPNATLVMLDATGHCPNLSAPDQTADAIERYLPRPAHV